MKGKYAYLSIGFGAALWGTMGIFVTGLYQQGFSPMQVAAIRTTGASLMLVLYLALRSPQLLAINRKHIYYFLGTGLLSLFFFQWFYFIAMREVSISVAVVLLYTAPAYVTVISRILFKEALTARKLTSLFFTLIGTILVIGLFSGGNVKLSSFGLIIGISSGIAFALYSIFGKLALEKYNPLTVITYSFLFASVGGLPLSRVWQQSVLFTKSITWIYILGMILIPTVFAFLFYTIGLQRVESSRAAIMATIEPVVAVLVGILVYRESIHFWQFLGMLMVFAAVLIVQENQGEKPVQKDVYP